MTKYIGKIEKATLQLDDYMESSVIINFTFFFDGKSIQTYTLASQEYLVKLFKTAKIANFIQLRNMPIEIVIELNTLQSWRILEEVL